MSLLRFSLLLSSHLLSSPPAPLFSSHVQVSGFNKSVFSFFYGFPDRLVLLLRRPPPMGSHTAKGERRSVNRFIETPNLCMC